MDYGKVTAIILGAGSSSRMNGLNKLIVHLGQHPVIAKSIDTLHNSRLISEIIIVSSKDNVRQLNSMVDDYKWNKVSNIVIGGDRRQDSVWQGLKSFPICDLVVIHDGARPFIDDNMLASGVIAASKFGAATAGIPIRDTIKRSDNSGSVTATLDRTNLWSVQTPQIFKYDVIMNAHQTVQFDVTDDAAMIESIGGTVTIFEGSIYNLKITEPKDLLLARAILQLKSR